MRSWGPRVTQTVWKRPAIAPLCGQLCTFTRVRLALATLNAMISLCFPLSVPEGERVRESTRLKRIMQLANFYHCAVGTVPMGLGPAVRAIQSHAGSYMGR